MLVMQPEFLFVAPMQPPAFRGTSLAKDSAPMRPSSCCCCSQFLRRRPELCIIAFVASDMQRSSEQTAVGPPP